LDLCRLLNNDLAQTVRQHPRRFVALGTVPLQAPHLAVEELKRCRHELGKFGEFKLWEGELLISCSFHSLFVWWCIFNLLI